MKTTFTLIYILFSARLFAQSVILPAQQPYIDSADIIFEGRDVKDSGFVAPNGKIYTQHTLLVLKWFKGTQLDTVKIITAGGIAQGKADFTNNPDIPAFAYSYEYLLYCRQDLNAVKPVNGTYYYPLTGPFAYTPLGKRFKPESARQPHFYDHLMAENYPLNLFEPLAKLIGTPYKTIRQDCTDHVIEYRKYEEFHRKQVSDSAGK